jgi:hypothetical protein
VERELRPRAERVEARDYETHRDLMARLGQDGFLGVDVPEPFGGAGLDRTASIVVTQALGAAGSFAVTYAAHTGIGTLPLVFFGTDEQRRRWLPGLAAGTTIGAYALTEPSAGSDALAIRTRASRQDDGGFRLDGSKQFITNAGFADLFTLYAKVDGEHFTAFLVERGTPGLIIGAEEEKMGLHGASTCPLTLDGVVVPADAVLGEIGQGHRVAFNVLNVGRFKLAAACLGGMSIALRGAAQYARDRVAFGRSIDGFGLVAGMLAAMVARTYAVESLVYRIAGTIDARLAGAEASGDPDAIRAALEEYAVECSAAKVLASEELDAVVDDAVQLHGGYGYIESYPAAAAYRDARINRIWEGTNEVNRLLIPGTLLRRAMKGRIDLLGPARRAQEALLVPAARADDRSGDGGPLDRELAWIDGLRQAALLLAGAAVQRYGLALEEEQEVLAGLADLSIALLATESALLRAAQAADGDALEEKRDAHLDLARLVMAQHAGRAELIARDLASTIGEGDEGRLLVAGMRRLLRFEGLDQVAVARRVAGHVRAVVGYPV